MSIVVNIIFTPSSPYFNSSCFPPYYVYNLISLLLSHKYSYVCINTACWVNLLVCVCVCLGVTVWDYLACRGHFSLN